MLTIGITGGTGFVGHHLTRLLLNKGHKVIIFSRETVQTYREPNLNYALWNPDKKQCDINALQELNGVVHLAGAGIADKRWTAERKKVIVDSRVKGTEFLVEQLKLHAPNCKVLISASATGFYGPDREGLSPFTEAAPPYPDFLGNTCKMWEAASESASHFLRRAIVRFGIVLGKESGAFPEFAGPMKFGIMPILGSGKQIVSWIHVDDLVQILFKLIEDDRLFGIYNGVSPDPVTHKKLMQTIAHEKGGVKIPVPAPTFALKIGLGEMSVEILKSCTVSARKILDAGYIFQYPTIEDAVRDLTH